MMNVKGENVSKGEKPNDVYLWNCKSIRIGDNYSKVLKLEDNE
jgi:hypothetical protein